jgi:hypothetical protein
MVTPLHRVESTRANGDTLPEWTSVLTHMAEMLAGTSYQSKVKEALYGHPTFDGAKHGSLYNYFSDILERARDARLFGRVLIVDSRDAGIFGREFANSYSPSAAMLVEFISSPFWNNPMLTMMR